jgi:hypothetical protein
MDFSEVICMIVGFGIAGAIVKGKNGWNDVVALWIRDSLVILACYVAWFVL